MNLVGGVPVRRRQSYRCDHFHDQMETPPAHFCPQHLTMSTPHRPVHPTHPTTFKHRLCGWPTRTAHHLKMLADEALAGLSIEQDQYDEVVSQNAQFQGQLPVNVGPFALPHSNSCA